ncbi:MAG: serine/threonine protein kinase [Deltaproteobacteria bacterium]|nr:serine/threonine protein kinase [Deltaproteobacteria bacterium]
MATTPARQDAPDDPDGARLLGPGDVIDGRYRVEALLGSGGMAAVYRATHVVLEQPFAVKVVSPQIRAIPGMAQRFLREARAATQLKGTHVARVSDVGTMADGSPYMVMEYLEGRDLDTIIEAHEVVPVIDVVDLVLQACEALAEVHGLGIIHRDLKPANLFLTTGADGLACVKLIDFGISRFDSPLSPKDLEKLTTPDTVMGSPRYMSPEQMESATKADERSDIYGLGAILYELLTLRAPHDGDTMLDIYAAATQGPPAAPSTLRPDVPRELDEVILRALRPDPSERFFDVAQLAAALAPFGPDGSLARAEQIERVLETSRLRTRDGTTAEVAFTPTEASSHVRRRVSSSAHERRRRRVRRGTIAAGLFVLVVAGVGTRFALTRAPAIAAPPAATATAPLAASETAPEPPALASAPAIVSAPVVSTPPARASMPTFTTIPPRPPPPSPAPPPPAPLPTNDEKKLFEDRK